MAGNKYGATPHSYEGIDFKSQLEVMIYKTLKEYGFEPQYEANTYQIVSGFYPTVRFYDRDKKTRQLKLQKDKIRSMTYTPDFTFFYNNYYCIIEAKGMENDAFPLKKKLFRAFMEKQKDSQFEWIYFEVRTKRE